MKKKVVILSAIAAFILLVLLLAPLFFKGKITRWIGQQVTRHMQAELHVGSMELSIFKYFPALGVTWKEVAITRIHNGETDTLLYLPLLEASVNMKSMFGDNHLIVNHALAGEGRLSLKVDADGNKNWDIFSRPEKSGSGTGEPRRNKTKTLEWNNVSIENFRVTYADYHSSTYAGVERVNMRLAENVYADSSLFDCAVLLDGISYRKQNTLWFSRTDVAWQAELACDREKDSYRITKNDLRINDLQLDLTGGMAMEDTGYGVDIRLNAPDNRFESLLSLLPQHLMEGLKTWETGGAFHLDAQVNGRLRNPSFHAALSVEDAFLRNPELPDALRNIRFDLQVENSGTDMDSTRIRLRKASFDMAGNPFELSLDIINPAHPYLEGGLKGDIDFAALSRVFPLQDLKLQGRLGANVLFKGEYCDIEEERYDRFTARGNITLRDILLVNGRFPRGISVPRANLTVTPSFLKLDHLQGKIYSSDFALRGKVFNYLPYLFKDETLRGNFVLDSRFLNLNEFILAQATRRKRDAENPQEDKRAGTPGLTDGVLEVPRHVDVRLSTAVRTLLFDRLQVENVSGEIRLADATATLDRLHMNLLQGNMSVSGNYNTANPQKPAVDFAVEATDFDIRSAYRAFTFIRKSLPVAAFCDGRVSAAMTFAAVLDNEMSPLMNTANGRGNLYSQGIVIHDNPAMKQLAAVFKNDVLNHLDISTLKIDFLLENGNITVSPFRTSFAGNPVSIRGGQSVDGALDYDLSLTLRREFFGKEVDKLLKVIPGADQLKSLDLDAHIGGTLAEPVIQPDLSKAVKAVAKEAEKALKGNLLQGLQNIFKKK